LLRQKIRYYRQMNVALSKSSTNDMSSVLVIKCRGHSRSISLGTVAVFCLLLLMLALSAGYWFALAEVKASKPPESELIVLWQHRLEQQQADLGRIRAGFDQQMDALTLRLGRIQGSLLRLDALGQRFVETGLVANDEFDFDQPAAVGGPEEEGMLNESYRVPEITDLIQRLEKQIEGREKQLRLLEKVVSRERLENEFYLQGRPVTWGWLSSKYGYRTDPFSGKRSWHAGVDLAGRDGSDIITIAAGVVTYAGERYGYGKMVEVDHGDGLVTRYAHAKSVKVDVGDMVQKGQVVALMGSTGRSTGPHVHFEVLRHGKAENPEKYIGRASR